MTGLYTVLVPLALFALLGASRAMVVGGDSATAAVLAAGLVSVGTPALQPESARWVTLSAATALMTAAFLLLARILRLGLIGDFLSGAALVGLFTGIGIQVAGDQIHQILGLPASQGNWLQQQWHWLSSLGSAQLVTTLYGLGTVALIALCKRFLPAIPGSLVAVVELSVVGVLTGAGSHGVKMIGAVSGGLPKLVLPTGVAMSDLTALVPVSLSCVVLIIARSAATARRVATEEDIRPDINRDLVGLSAANLGAGLTGTFVVNGSPTKTQVLTDAKGHTQLANLVVVAVTAILLAFLTGLLAHLPQAVLAGVVFMIGVSLVDAKGMSRVAKHSRVEFVIALVTMGSAVLLGITWEIGLAVLLSLLDVIAHQYRAPADVLIPTDAGGYDYVRARPGVQSETGLIVFRFGADLFFANATGFVDRVQDLVAKAPEPVRWFVFDASSISNIDYSASANLTDLFRYLREHQIEVVLARPSPEFIDLLTRFGLGPYLERAHIYPDLDTAVAAFRSETASSTSPTPKEV